ncbi:MAG: DNA alkylation repair protein, partial [Vicinamibacterales bacterium]
MHRIVRVRPVADRRPGAAAMALTATAVKARLRALADPDRAAGSARFFKTGPGEYGEGDRFLGLTVPAQRRVARAYRDLPLAEVARLLASPVHEDRFTALEILVMQYERGDAASRTRVFRFYLA